MQPGNAVSGRGGVKPGETRTGVRVRVVTTGTYRLGSERAKAFPKSTFTMKHKPQGGSAYRISPQVSNGDNGPSATGLTRRQSSDDS